MPKTKTDGARWKQTVQRSISKRLGFRLFVTSIVAFVVLAVLVAARASWVVSLDRTVQEKLIKLRSPWLNETMTWVTRLGNRWTIGALLFLLTLWVLRTGRCQKALTVMIIAFLANPPLEYVLKTIVDRPRPDIARLVPGNGPSFPSGHVLATVGFYGVLAAVLWRSSNRRSVRVAGYAIATMVILGVAISRAYLDVHWFSDVVGALLVGTAFVITVTWSLRGHHFGGELGCEFSTRVSE